MPAIDLSILNQRQTPAFYADVFANRPAAGFVGRIFVSTNTFAFYRDNGTGWDLIGGPGTGTITGSGAAGQVSFWNGASTITGENNLWWDSTNNHLGINTNTPATALDVNHNGTLVAKFNNTTSANSLIAFENAGNEQWWIGTENTNNDFLFYDATNFPTLSLRTTFKTNGQVLIGGGSTGSGKLVIESATSDNGIQIVGASAPSLRIDSAATGPTKRIGLGISTAANNFIQGSVDRDMCIFNGSTTASPMLFGIYDTTNVQEAARISAARNFLIGTTTDGGQKLQVNGGARTTGYYLAGMTAGSGALYWSSDRVTLANYNVGGSLMFEINGGTQAATLTSGGLFGIGTITPAFKLDVANAGGLGIRVQNTLNTDDAYLQATSTLGSALFGINATGQYLYNGTNLPILFYTNAAERMRITGSGLVGIGTNAPSTQLDVIGNGRFFPSSGDVTISLRGYASQYIAFTEAFVADRGIIGFPVGSADLVYRSGAFNMTNGTERFRVAGSTGNFLIGTATDDGNKLQVNGTGVFSGDIKGTVDLYLLRSGVAPAIVLSQQQVRFVDQSTGFSQSININSDNLQFSGGIRTAAPSGGSQQTWKLGNYTAGVAVQAGKVRVEINGVAYDLLTA
jgi:hypothetical protein